MKVESFTNLLSMDFFERWDSPEKILGQKADNILKEFLSSSNCMQKIYPMTSNSFAGKNSNITVKSLSDSKHGT